MKKIVFNTLHAFTLITLVHLGKAKSKLQIYEFTRNSSLSFPGKRLEGHVFEEFSTKKQVIHCAYECLKSSRCRSFNYERDAFVCQLNDGDHVEFGTSLVAGVNGSRQEYHHRKAFSLNQEALGPCAADPCQNGGRCLDTMNWKMERVYFCICTDEWMGHNCEMPTNRIDWDQWEDWGPCSVTCETGWTTRRRRCIDVETGETMSSSKCYGRDVEYQACSLQSCPRWLDWSEWSMCSTADTCGRGVKHRYRECSNGGTPGLDRYCLGFTNETASCQGINCRGMLMLKDTVKYGDGRIEIFDDLGALKLAVCADENWNHTEIDIACKQIGFQGAYQGAIDNKYNNSSIPNDSQIYMLTCTGKEKTIQQCARVLVQQCQSLAGIQCRIRGGWSLWDSWDECSSMCGHGTRKRMRDCNHPPPNYGGTECPGENKQLEECSIAACPVNGFWNSWGNWGDCSTTCGGGLRNRTRECTEPEHGGAHCVGPSEEAQECNTLNCPVDGVLSEWERWNECSVTCANGTRYRIRTCSDPMYGGANCSDTLSEEEPCMMSECPVNGIWDSWQPWQDCNVTCGQGLKIRQRLCTGPYFGGLDCEGSAFDTEGCNRPDCPVDGEWKPWSSWENCDVTCGGGSQGRTRDCIAPQYGGVNCTGSSEERQECSTDVCPIDGIYTEWTEWSACSFTCGNGSMYRNRTCYGPYFGGHPCIGPDMESTLCFIQECPVPGNWHPWTEWTLCTVTCGGGTRYRNRTCDWDSFGNLTLACEGVDEEIGDCHTFDCRPLAIHCADWASRGLNQTCIADVYPLNMHVQVECDFDTQPGEAVTIMHHDQENKTRVKGFEGAGSFEALLTYDIGWGQAIRIVDKSGDCAQFVRWDCFGTIIHNPFDQTTMTTFWMNRTEQMTYYFGGARPGSGNCACGETNSCFNKSLSCNCDANDEVWRFDEGFITNKVELPIYSFHAGDTGGEKEDAYMTLGPLLCSGLA